MSKIERSTYVLVAAFLTYVVMIAFALIGHLPGWVWVVALPLHFVAGMGYEQEKCKEVGPVRVENFGQTRT